MMFENSRWVCPVCHKHTFTTSGEVEAVCEHCGCNMSAASVLFAISAKIYGAMKTSEVVSRSRVGKLREGHA